MCSIPEGGKTFRMALLNDQALPLVIDKQKCNQANLNPIQVFFLGAFEFIFFKRVCYCGWFLMSFIKRGGGGLSVVVKQLGGDAHALSSIPGKGEKNGLKSSSIILQLARQSVGVCGTSFQTVEFFDTACLFIVVGGY